MGPALSSGTKIPSFTRDRYSSGKTTPSVYFELGCVFRFRDLMFFVDLSIHICFPVDDTAISISPLHRASSCFRRAPIIAAQYHATITSVMKTNKPCMRYGH